MEIDDLETRVDKEVIWSRREPQTFRVANVDYTLSVSYQIIHPPTDGMPNHVLMRFTSKLNYEGCYKVKQGRAFKFEMDLTFEGIDEVLATSPSPVEDVTSITKGWNLAGGINLAMSPSANFTAEISRSKTGDTMCPHLAYSERSDPPSHHWEYDYRKANNGKGVDGKPFARTTTFDRQHQTVLLRCKQDSNLRVRWNSTITVSRKKKQATASVGTEVTLTLKPASETLGIVTVGDPLVGKSSFLESLFEAVGSPSGVFRPGVLGRTARLTVDYIDPKTLPPELRCKFDPDRAIQCVDICGRQLRIDPESLKDPKLQPRLRHDDHQFLDAVMKGLKAGTDLTNPAEWMKAEARDSRNKIHTLVLVTKAPALEGNPADRHWVWEWIPAMFANAEYPQLHVNLGAMVRLIDVLNSYCKVPPYLLITHMDQADRTTTPSLIMQHLRFFRPTYLFESNTFFAAKVCHWRRSMKKNEETGQDEVTFTHLRPGECNHSFTAETLEAYRKIALCLAADAKVLALRDSS